MNVLGGSCAAWFRGWGNSASADGEISTSTRKRSPFSADLFGSICYSFQHGQFIELYRDLTRVDARLDICSAFAVTERAFNLFRRSSVSSANNPLSSPRLNLTLQQQVLRSLNLSFLFVVYECIGKLNWISIYNLIRLMTVC